MSKLDVLTTWWRHRLRLKSSAQQVVITTQPLIIPDERTIYFGQFEETFDFRFVIFLLQIGIQNMIFFPYLVYNFGGILFWIFNFLLSFFLVVPIYSLEIGLGQFYSRTAVSVFKIVPICRGLGWSMMVVNFLSMITYSTSICPAVLYFVYSLYTDMPWTYCGKRYPSINCTQNYVNSSEDNNFPILLTPGQIIFDIEFQGIRSKENGLKYVFMDKIGPLRINFLIAIIAVWGLTFLFTCMILKFYTRILYHYALCIWFLILLMFMRTIFLRGSFQGISLFLAPDMQKWFTIKSLFQGFSYCMSSMYIGTGTVTALASLNKFHLNFHKATFTFICTNFLVGLSFGILIFSTTGYYHKLDNCTDNHGINPRLVYSTFIDSISSLKDARIWTLMYSFFVINIGLSANSISMVGFILNLIDIFPKAFNYSNNRKFVGSFIVTLVLCSFSLLFSFSATVIYVDVIDFHLQHITVPIIVLYECSVVFYIYGEKRFRSEMKMMLGFSYNCIWSFSGMVLIPVLTIIGLPYSFYLAKTNLESSVTITLASYLITFVVFIPTNIFVVKELYANSKLYKRKEIFTNSFKTPDYLGPYYKEHWLIRKYYQQKLVSLRNDPKFLKTVRKTEDLSVILFKLKKILHDKQIIRKEMIKKAKKKMKKINFK